MHRLDGGLRDMNEQQPGAFVGCDTVIQRQLGFQRSSSEIRQLGGGFLDFFWGQKWGRSKMGSGRYLLLLSRYVFRSSFWAGLARRGTRQSSLRLSGAGSSGRRKAQVAVIRRIHQENLILGLGGGTQEHGIGFSEIRNCYPETEGWCQRDH